MRFVARLFIFFVSCVLLLGICASSANAQYSNPYTTPNTDINVPANLHTYTQSIMLEVLAALTCQITGQDPISSSHQCLGINTSTGKIGYMQKSDGGAIGFVNNMISNLYTPPIHTSDYVHYMASSFGFVKHTYAASANGIGFDQLTPLLSLWTTFRNISYFAFVLIFVAIGFAVMLRVKIDPRTVMTIENQIPKILIGLILVTFSYAIAGFLIDMMYVTTYITVNVISNSQSAYPNTVTQIQSTETKDLSGGNPLGFANDIIPSAKGNPGGLLGITLGSAGSIKDILANLLASGDNTSAIHPSTDPNAGLKTAAVGVGVTAICGVLTGITLGLALVPCLAAGAGAALITGVSVGGVDLGKLVSSALGVVVSWIAGILAFLIIGIALLIALIRVWFTLLMAYVSILLEIVLAPFFIIFGVFPGSKVGFGSWLKSMVGNLLAFPVTVAMFLLAGVFMNSFAQNATGIFVPPLIGNPQGGAGQSPVAYLIALGMILLTPSVTNMMRELLKAPKNQYLQSIAGNLGAGAAPLGGGVKAIFNYNSPDIGGGKQKWRGVIGGLLGRI